MQAPLYATLFEISPGYYDNQLVLSVDRIFAREKHKKVGELEREVKDTECLDMICWDKEGTRIVCSVESRAAVEIHGQAISEKRTYMVSRYKVARPGYGMHNRYHLLFDEFTSFALMYEPYIGRVFNLRTPTDIPKSFALVGLIYDVCGFVKHVSNVGSVPVGGFIEKEFTLGLDAKLKGVACDVKGSVTIYLRGGIHVAEWAKLKKKMKNNHHAPFVLIKNLRLVKPAIPGAAIMHSVSEATEVVHDIHVEEVLVKRAQIYQA